MIFLLIVISVKVMYVNLLYLVLLYIYLSEQNVDNEESNFLTTPEVRMYSVKTEMYVVAILVRSS